MLSKKKPQLSAQQLFKKCESSIKSQLPKDVLPGDPDTYSKFGRVKTIDSYTNKIKEMIMWEFSYTGKKGDSIGSQLNRPPFRTAVANCDINKETQEVETYIIHGWN